MIIQCECGEEISYNELKTQCPNDIIDQTKWEQDSNGKWKCLACQN